MVSLLHGGCWSLMMEKLTEGREQHLFLVGCVEGNMCQVEEDFLKPLLLLLFPSSFLGCFLEGTVIPESWTPSHFHFRTCPLGSWHLQSALSCGEESPIWTLLFHSLMEELGPGHMPQFPHLWTLRVALRIRGEHWPENFLLLSKCLLQTSYPHDQSVLHRPTYRGIFRKVNTFLLLTESWIQRYGKS